MRDSEYVESRWRDARRAIHDRQGKAPASVDATWLALRLGVVVLAVIVACVALGVVGTWLSWGGAR